MVRISVASTNATLEGQKFTPYQGPGQGFSGLALLGEANQVYGINLSMALAFQPEQPVTAAATVAVQLCGGLEAFDVVLNRCACSPGAERLFSGDCACVPAPRRAPASAPALLLPPAPPSLRPDAAAASGRRRPAGAFPSSTSSRTSTSATPGRPRRGPATPQVRPHGPLSHD